MKYKMLDANKKIILTEDILLWANFMNSSDKIVKQEEINSCGKTISISTVFIGGYASSFPMLSFETLVTGATEDEYLRRYSSYRSAVRGHAQIIKSFSKKEQLFKKWINAWKDLTNGSFETLSSIVWKSDETGNFICVEGGDNIVPKKQKVINKMENILKQAAPFLNLNQNHFELNSNLDLCIEQWGVDEEWSGEMVLAEKIKSKVPDVVERNKRRNRL